MFNIKKSFRLLGLVLSGSILLSFIPLSTSAYNINNTSEKAFEWTILGGPQAREAWELVNSSAQISITTPEIEDQRAPVDETKRKLEFRIENIKHTLKNFILSDNDIIYLSLFLQSTFESLIYFRKNINPLSITNDSKTRKYIQYFRETKDRKINSYLSQHPCFSISGKEVIALGNLCSNTFVYIFNTAYYWSCLPLIFAKYFAYYIISKYLQEFVNYVCKNHTFEVGSAYVRI